MVKAVHILDTIADLPKLENRGDETEAEADAAFATLAEFGNGALFAGSFSGVSPWERHRNGDEIVQILKGATKLTLMFDDGPVELEMSEGMVTVVPQGTWHRF